MKTELLHGTLEVMILKVLTWGPMHGYGVGKHIESLAGGALRIEEGSLYPALYRLEKKGWIDAEWGVSEKNRRARYYRLAPPGRRALKSNVSTWVSFAEAVGRVLNATEMPARA